MKKGFTLIELLGVIILLALIAAVTVPIISSSLVSYRESLCNTQLNEIKEAARAWGVDHIAVLPEQDGMTTTITLKTLMDAGLIDSEIINPLTREPFDKNNTRIVITKNGRKYNYELDNTTKNFCAR